MVLAAARMTYLLVWLALAVLYVACQDDRWAT